MSPEFEFENDMHPNSQACNTAPITLFFAKLKLSLFVLCCTSSCGSFQAMWP